MLDTIDVIPRHHLSKCEKIMCVVRLLFFISIILLLLKFYRCCKCALICLLVTLFVYLIVLMEPGHSTTEAFTETCIMNTQYSDLNPDDRLYKPVYITPPVLEFEDWKDGPDSVRSGINTASRYSYNAPINYHNDPVDDRDFNDFNDFNRCWRRIQVNSVNSRLAVDPRPRTLREKNTMYLQPNILVEYPEEIVPAITNAGITYTHHWRPMERVRECRPNPNVIRNVIRESQSPRLGPVGPESVYDPRTFGYGDETRSYLEPTTGQVRYYYDDVDVARQDPFLCRNNVPGSGGSIPIGAADALYRASINQHREDLQFSLMQKGNEVLRQRRLAPIRRT